MFFFYLPDGSLSCTFEFEFHDVDVVGSLYDEVDASFGCVILSLGVETNKFEEDEEHILIVQFKLLHQFVGSIGKEGLQTLEEGFGLPPLYFLHEFLYLERGFYFGESGIEGQEELDETFFHLAVGEAQAIETELLVITLDGEEPL